VFVRRKKVKGNTYYQLVRNYREDGKHKQQVLCHLGPHKSLEAAIETESRIVENEEYEATHADEEAQSIKKFCLEKYADLTSETFPSRRQASLRWRSSWNIPRRWRDEYERRALVNEYHDYMEWARQVRKWAADHRKLLNKFLECKSRYF
jgi:hypothetical protein